MNKEVIVEKAKTGGMITGWFLIAIICAVVLVTFGIFASQGIEKVFDQALREKMINGLWIGILILELFVPSIIVNKLNSKR